MIRARVVPNHAAKAFGNAAARSPMRLATAMRLGIEIGKSEVVQRTPVGWSSALRGGYHTEMRGQGTIRPRAILANAILYHDVREEGRRPGRMPPVAALIPWVGSKLGVPPGDERRQVAFLVARKIGRRGYPGAFMVRDGWTAARLLIRPIFTKLGYDIVRDIR